MYKKVPPAPPAQCGSKFTVSPKGYFDLPSPEPAPTFTLVPVLVLTTLLPPPPVPPVLLFETPKAVNEVSPVIIVPEAVFLAPIVTLIVDMSTLSISSQ